MEFSGKINTKQEFERYHLHHILFGKILILIFTFSTSKDMIISIIGDFIPLLTPCSALSVFVYSILLLFIYKFETQGNYHFFGILQQLLFNNMALLPIFLYEQREYQIISIFCYFGSSISVIGRIVPKFYLATTIHYFYINVL